jgi:hypothetical protein
MSHLVIPASAGISLFYEASDKAKRFQQKLE